MSKIKQLESQMIEAGAKCAREYSHRRAAGQVYDDLPIECLYKNSKPTTKTAKRLIAASDAGFESVK